MLEGHTKNVNVAFAPDGKSPGNVGSLTS